MNPGAADVCNVVQSRVLCLDGFELKPKTRLAGKPSDSCSALPGVTSDMSLLRFMGKIITFFINMEICSSSTLQSCLTAGLQRTCLLLSVLFCLLLPKPQPILQNPPEAHKHQKPLDLLFALHSGSAHAPAPSNVPPLSSQQTPTLTFMFVSVASAQLNGSVSEQTEEENLQHGEDEEATIPAAGSAALGVYVSSSLFTLTGDLREISKVKCWRLEYTSSFTRLTHVFYHNC